MVISTSTVESKTYYTWVDRNGVTHVTEYKDEIPKSRLNTVKTFESRGRFDFITTNYFYIKSNLHKFIRYVVYFLLAVLALIILRRIFKNIRMRSNQYRLNKRIQKIDDSGVSSLSSYQFKVRARELLEKTGYKLSSPNTQFEELIDYIGFKNGKKFAICVHDSENLVSRIVVSEIDREKHKHLCDNSLIVCRSYFEEDVIEFAKEVGCELIDKDKLSELLQKAK